MANYKVIWVYESTNQDKTIVETTKMYSTSSFDKVVAFLKGLQPKNKKSDKSKVTYRLEIS